LCSSSDIFTGLVNEQLPANQRYDEVHTGDAWMPGRNCFCQQMDKTNVMPVRLILFGDKSHTDLHGALSVTPIIFTLTSLIGISETIAIHGDHWRIFPICHMERIKQTRQNQRTKDKMNTAGFPWH